MARILYSNATSVTGKVLKQVLGINGGTMPSQNRDDVLIRWGATVSVPKKAGKTLNKQSAITLATQKLASLNVMQEKHISVPVVLQPNEAAKWMSYAKGALLGRRVNHTQGKDIVFCLQTSDVARALTLPTSERPDFFTAYIPTKREFRVHVFGNEVIKVSEKVLTDLSKFKVSWIRNFENGFTFKNVTELVPQLKNQMNDLSIAAVQALGLDFGAVDVVLSDDGKLYVLEVNTGPSLSDNSVKEYATKFAAILNVQPNWSVLENNG
jgi:glutathione synthase/RimK-type ligase-like ATP-grasp enzyme